MNRKGTFYGVGIGPGDPEWMSLKAYRCLEQAKLLAVPQTNGEKNLALDILSQVIDLSQKEILYIDFAMTRDPKLLAERHQLGAKRIAARLEQGEDVVMPNIGDVSLYATFSYLQALIAEAGYSVEVIPGIPSFCAVAAKLQKSLTTMQQPLHIIPAGKIDLSEALKLPGSKVLMKSGKSFGQVRDALREAGLLEKASMVIDCGLPTEQIFENLEDAPEDAGYFTTILVQA
jgi:precorrin-2/cobalt-factor-2 C20-methyltransferase